MEQVKIKKTQIDVCLKKTARSISKRERAATANKKKREGAKGETVVPNTKKAKVRVNMGGEMRKQNRVKMKNGGFIAKGCGKVMNDRRKVTTIS